MLNAPIPSDTFRLGALGTHCHSPRSRLQGVQLLLGEKVQARYSLWIVAVNPWTVLVVSSS